MRSIELRHLRYFLAVAERLHFGRAAEALGIAQPPLSQQIQQLEHLLGHQLFIRRPRVRLTKAGESFSMYARKTLVELGRGVEVVRCVGDGSAGQLAVGFAASTLLSPLAEGIRAYRSAFPDVELTLFELSTADQIAALQEGRIDVGFLRMPPSDTIGLVMEEIHSEQFSVALPPKHPMSSRRSIDLRQLEGDAFILFPREVAPRLYDQIHHLFLAASYDPNIVIQAREWITIVALVAAGMGVSIVPESFRQLQWGDVG